MNRSILSIKNSKEILKYSLCISASLVTVLGINVVNTLAAMGDNASGDNNGDNYSVSNAENNALNSMGIRDYDTVKNHVDFYTPDGELASRDYIESVANKGNIDEYLIVKFKDDANSQKLGQIFGSNGSALQNYLDTQGSNYTQALDSLLDIQKQIAGISGLITTSSGDSVMSFDPVTNKLTIKEGTEFSKIINNGDLDKLADLINKWKELTGNDDILSMTEGELETIISKTDRAEDINVALKANKKTFDSITKVRFTITNKNNGTPATNVSVDQAGTQQLFSQYNSSWVSKYKTMTGNSFPAIQQVSPGTFEMDIGKNIYSLDDKWTKILKNWTVGAGGGDFLGVGMFDITPSAEPLEIKVQVIGDRYTYYENISKQGTYPTGHSITKTSQSISNDSTDYTFENFKNSYYYGSYDDTVNSKTGSISKVIGKVPNYNVRASVSYITKWKWESENRIDWSVFPYDYYRDEDGSRTVFWYQTSYQEPYYEKEIIDKNAKYKGVESINNVNSKGDRPLYSLDDGTYVRDIWFRTQYIRYWDFKDEIITGVEAYSDAPYVVSKIARSSISPSDNKPLVRFANESDRLKGIVLTKEKENNWAAPNKIESRTLKETVWTLSPLSGKIRIPVLTQTGEMEGVINEAGMNIGN